MYKTEHQLWPYLSPSFFSLDEIKTSCSVKKASDKKTVNHSMEVHELYYYRSWSIELGIKLPQKFPLWKIKE